MVVDVAGFSNPARTLLHQVDVQKGLYHILQDAFAESGISWDLCVTEDRGDGVMILIPPEVPKILLADQLADRVVAALRRYNALRSPEASVQLRISLHFGEVLQNRNGVVSPAVVFAFRILDAPVAKSALKESAGMVAFIASDLFFREVIAQDAAADPASYQPIPVDVNEVSSEAWLRLRGSLARPAEPVRTQKPNRLIAAPPAVLDVLSPADKTPNGGCGPKRILVLATEWFSAHGGLSALNRRLCQALAASGAEVYCLVLNASEQERQDAARSGVQLIDATHLVGSSEQEALSRRPRLPNSVIPHLIIGHGRITGRAAAVIASDHFDNVPRLHILHMAPDETEWLKLDRQNDVGLTAEQRMNEERALLRPPAIGAGVGPRLHDLVQAELAAFPDAAEPVRIDPGFDTAQATVRTPPRGRPVRVLLLGRMEDRMVKGLDLAARALAEAVGLLKFDASKVEFVVRGVPAGEFSEVRDAVHRWSGKRSLRVAPRSYTVDSEELEQDLLRATLVLMPSRADGFGLVGMEAIIAATPVLVSDASGLGDLLHEVLSRDEAARLVVPITDDDDRDAQRWGAAIAAILKDPAGAFANAERVRNVMGRKCTWAMAANAVLRVIT